MHEQAGLCGAGDLPETGVQGDVPKADQDSGRAEQGYNCGLSLVGHEVLDADGRTPTGNANMAWAGHCAYVAGRGALFGEPSPTPGDGVAVVDVSDPTNPVHVRTLRTPGALATSETLHAVETPERSILVVGQYGNASQNPTPMDVYDVTDCANPLLLETYYWPFNIHNLTVSGNSRYVFATQPLQAADISPLFDEDPTTGTVFLGNLDEVVPAPPVAFGPTADVDDLLPDEVNGLSRTKYLAHEAWPSDDGTTLYIGGQQPTFEILTIVDLTAWLDRSSGVAAGPPEIISQRSGRAHSLRTGTIRADDGTVERRILLHSEESVFGLANGCVPEDLNPFAGPAQPWLTDITDPTDPAELVQFGLAINDLEHCPDQLASGINASVHYHDVDDADDTTFVMASMWNAGIRVFDVREPERPVEVAYFNPADVLAGPGVALDQAWGHIRWVPETGHIWYASSLGGFFVLELEPQVRTHLGLDGEGPPPLQHPEGAPGTGGVQLVTEVAPSRIGPGSSRARWPPRPRRPALLRSTMRCGWRCPSPPRGRDQSPMRRGPGPELVLHGDVVGVEERPGRHQGLRPAAAEDLGGLGALEAGVDRHEHGAALEEAEDRGDPPPAVGGPDRHPVTRLDAGGDEGGADGNADELHVSLLGPSHITYGPGRGGGLSRPDKNSTPPRRTPPIIGPGTPSSGHARSSEPPSVNAPDSIRHMRSTTLLVLVAVMFIAAGGFIHLTEWLDVYRHVPASAPGAAVVRIGFPVNAAASLVLVFALVLLVRRPSRLTRPAIFTALVFQAASLATLIATRVDSAFGWSEPTWTPAAEQARAVEIAALAGLGALAAIHRRSSSSGKLQDVSAERTPIPSRAGRCGDHPVALRQP